MYHYICACIPYSSYNFLSLLAPPPPPPPPRTAVVEGDTLDGIYEKVKSVIHEQSGNYIWVPSSDTQLQ